MVRTRLVQQFGRSAHEELVFKASVFVFFSLACLPEEPVSVSTSKSRR